MHCLRCRNKMIHERSFTVGRSLYVWHCLICGEVYDPVIVLNRLNQHANTVFHTQKERHVPLSKEMFPVMKKKPVDFSSF